MRVLGTFMFAVGVALLWLSTHVKDIGDGAVLGCFALCCILVGILGMGRNV